MCLFVPGVYVIKIIIIISRIYYAIIVDLVNYALFVASPHPSVTRSLGRPVKKLVGC